MSDITPGHTFAAGEQVTHTKLNTPPTIATAFYTGKSTLAAYDPNNCTLLVYDSGSGTFKRGTLAAAIFDNDALIKDRSAATTPTDAWLLPIQDPTGNIYKVTRANIFYQWLNLTGLLDAAGALGGTAGTALKVLVDGLTLEIATNALQLKDGGITPPKLAPKAVTPAKLQGVYDSGWIISTCTLIAAGSASHAHGLAALPGEIKVWLKIGATQNGWTAGDIIELSSLPQTVAAAYIPPIVGADTTNIFLATGGGVYLPHKTTSAVATVLTDVGGLNRIRIVARLTEHTGI